MRKILILLFIISSYTFAANDKATVVGFVGKAELKSGKKWLSIKIDDKISTNAKIRIKSKEDYLELIMPDGKMIKILGGVEDKLGKIIARQPKLEQNNKEEKFAVVERTGAAAVRGGIGKPGVKKEVPILKKGVVRGYVGECKVLIGETWSNISYGFEIDYTNKISIKETNSFLRLELDGIITNIYGPLEMSIEEVLSGGIK